MQPLLTQVQSQRQTQVLAPQMRQSLEFLQAPMMELRTLIRRELEQNPVLEERPEEHEPLETTEEPAQETGAVADDETREASARAEVPVDGVPDGFVESAEIQAGLDPDLRTDEQVRDDEEAQR